MCKKNFQIELLLDGYKEWGTNKIIYLNGTSKPDKITCKENVFL